MNSLGANVPHQYLPLISYLLISGYIIKNCFYKLSVTGEGCASFSEARMSLSALVQSFKDTITDPEKHMGRLSKDDRVSKRYFFIIEMQANFPNKSLTYLSTSLLCDAV